ncbi:hypothetical protein SAFG77S_11623 [Streptomyces afghaniensis]|uniref:hypothetical protein n=1 Tax=Bacillus sp. J37 TaxID=935837 RepID=UPI00047B0333|nr:hypothetical protein [Bacillus sp. J37]
MNAKDNESGYLVTSYTQGFDSKEEAMGNIRQVQAYLDNANIKNKSHYKATSKQFVRMNEDGTPHAMGVWKESERTRGKIEAYLSNMYWFNFNDLSNIHPDSLPKVISDIKNGPFRYLQESFSSGSELIDNKYHLYLPVTELRDVDFEVQQLIYEWVRDDLEIKLGIQLDKSTYLHKNILASRNKVIVNEDAPVFDLKPYLAKFKRIEKVLKKRNKNFGKEDVIHYVVNEEFKEKKIISMVNFNELFKAFKVENFANGLTYKERNYLFMVLNNLQEEGQITEIQKYELAEVLCNGKSN